MQYKSRGWWRQINFSNNLSFGIFPFCMEEKKVGKKKRPQHTQTKLYLLNIFPKWIVPVRWLVRFSQDLLENEESWHLSDPGLISSGIHFNISDNEASTKSIPVWSMYLEQRLAYTPRCKQHWHFSQHSILVTS